MATDDRHETPRFAPRRSGCACPPRKARLVAEHIRGRSVPEARAVLAFTQRAAAREIEKVLRSAVANAEANHGLDRRRARRRDGVRRRGPDAEALARPRARPRRPHPEAHLPHHASPCATVEALPDQKRAAGGCPARPTGARPRRTKHNARIEEHVAEANARMSEPAEAEDDREPPRPKRSPSATPRDARRRGDRQLMGQKIHPGGLRVGVIHDWKSNWYAGQQGLPATPCSRTSRSASTSTASFRTPACPTS